MSLSEGAFPLKLGAFPSLPEGAFPLELGVFPIFSVPIKFYKI